MEKSIPELKAEFVCVVWGREKKISFEIHVIILRHIKNVNLPFKKKKKNLQNFLSKHPFFFTLETVLKMAKETNEGEVQSMCAKVTKHASKKWRKLKLI